MENLLLKTPLNNNLKDKGCTYQIALLGKSLVTDFIPKVVQMLKEKSYFTLELQGKVTTDHDMNLNGVFGSRRFWNQTPYEGIKQGEFEVEKKWYTQSQKRDEGEASIFELDF